MVDTTDSHRAGAFCSHCQSPRTNIGCGLIRQLTGRVRDGTSICDAVGGAAWHEWCFLAPTQKTITLTVTLTMSHEVSPLQRAHPKVSIVVAKESGELAGTCLHSVSCPCEPPCTEGYNWSGASGLFVRLVPNLGSFSQCASTANQDTRGFSPITKQVRREERRLPGRHFLSRTGFQGKKEGDVG